MPAKKLKNLEYWVIDDETGPSVQNFLAPLEAASEGLKLVAMQPTSFEDEVDKLRAGKFDGLIFDLRLGDRANAETAKKARYTAQGLAQEMRSLMMAPSGEGSPRAVPIVLWSTENKIRQFYSRDDTAKDLFDRVYEKKKVGKSATQISLELVDLSRGYAAIFGSDRSNKDKANKAFKKIYGIAHTDLSDERVLEALSVQNARSVHDIARTTLNQLILTPGPLVAEQLVAVRLGVDREKSPDWSKLLEKLDACKYAGIFGNAWPRWWWNKIDNWWVRSLKTKADLMTTPAETRVDLLKKATGLKQLEPLAPGKLNRSTKFWTVCMATEIPLDPTEGLRASIVPDREPWQDKGYLSLNSILERKAQRKGLAVHPFDRERYEALKVEAKG